MLTVLTGFDALGLSRHALEHIRNEALEREQTWILLVPEQFSFEAERRLCQIGGETISRFAEVLSFSHLSERIASKVGGAAKDYLDKGGQLLAMALAAEQVASRIKLYAAVLRKPEFLTDVLRMITEFRSYCLEPKDLIAASRKMEGQFAQKLEELGLLYEAYLAVCANSKADPSDKVLRMLSMIEECDWINSVHFYIDGFSDFTGAEEKVIQLLMQQAAEVRINLPTGSSGSVMERTADITMRELIHMAKSCMVEYQVIRTDVSVKRNEAITHLVSHMFSYEQAAFEENAAVRLVVCRSAEQECREAVRCVMQLLAQGVRCRDISLACTDMKRYEVPLRNAFTAAGISVYFAGETSLLSKAIVNAVVNSLFAAVGPMDYEDAALYLKSGLPLAEREDCDLLDNYAYLWNLRASRWSEQLKLHPRGFGEKMTDEDLITLNKINEVKDVIMAPLLNLRKGLQSAENTADMVAALYRFIEELELRRRLENRANTCAETGDGQGAQELVQIYEILIASMEQMWLTLGQTQRTPDDFCRLYQTVLTQYKVATVPAGIDQVYVSDLPDLRNKQTEHLIVIGASDGSFPAFKAAEGLLTEEDRAHLLEIGLAVAPGKADQMDRELSKTYRALSSATKSLYISYSGDQPAWLLRRAEAAYPYIWPIAEEECVLNAEELAAWKQRHGLSDQHDGEKLRSIRAEIKERCSYGFSKLGDEAVGKLYGAPIVLSPSKIDKYASCRFAFLMNYGLKAKPRKQAKLDQPAFGTFVHAVLEHTVLRVMDQGGFEAVSKETLLEIALDEIERYAEEFFPEQAKREEYLFNRSKEEIKSIVLDLWEELRRSAFRPVFCELKFDDHNGALPAVEIRGKDAACRVVGMVDRVDLFRDQDTAYIRVVDYKTGTKNFDYTDILNGAGLQMLIYLFALQTAGKSLIGEDRLEPAGILYLPAKTGYPLTEPMPDDAVVEEKHRSLRKRKGLIREEDILLAAMEEDPENPLFMPYKCGRSGKRGDLADRNRMKLLEHHVTQTIEEMTDMIASGAVKPNPMIRGQYSSCNYCDYKTVCHKDLDQHEPRILAETSADKFWEILMQKEKSHG